MSTNRIVKRLKSKNVKKEAIEITEDFSYSFFKERFKDIFIKYKGVFGIGIASIFLIYSGNVFYSSYITQKKKLTEKSLVSENYVVLKKSSPILYTFFSQKEKTNILYTYNKILESNDKEILSKYISNEQNIFVDLVKLKYSNLLFKENEFNKAINTLLTIKEKNALYYISQEKMKYIKLAKEIKNRKVK